jgi:hypothetical protein
VAEWEVDIRSGIDDAAAAETGLAWTADKAVSSFTEAQMFRVWFVLTAIMAAGFALYAALRDYPMITIGVACLVALAWWMVIRVRNLANRRELR